MRIETTNAVLVLCSVIETPHYHEPETPRVHGVTALRLPERTAAGMIMSDHSRLNLADYFLFDRLAEGMGDDIAILFGDRRFSYAEVAERSNALAAHLISAGLLSEQRVLIVLQDTPAFAWTFFATLRAGGVVAMGNPVSPSADLEYLLRYTRATVLVTDDEVAGRIAATIAEQGCHLVVAKRVATGEDVLDTPNMPPAAGGVTLAAALADGSARVARGEASSRSTHRDDHAIWLFTSGSTGQSKAAMHAHGDFAFNTEHYALGTVGYRKGDVTVSVPRLFFGYATGTNLMFPFRVGATAGLFAERPTPESLAEAIARYRPTVVTNVPTMMGKLLDHDEARVAAGGDRLDLSCVRFHLSAGEALPPTLLSRFMERFGAEVYDGIGSAEMFHIYCSNRPGDITPGSLGRAVKGYEIRVLPVDAGAPGAEPVASGESGVMWVKGDSVAMGYFRDRAKSWSTFHGHWCRTGDLFRVDDQGYYRFEGRADDLLKVGGIWVAPVEVEACLSEHAAVLSAAVIGAEESAGLVKPKAFVVVRDEERARVASEDARAELAQELKTHVQERLSKHKYPRWIVFTDDLPRNDRGKINRKLLNEREASGDNPTGH
jgi:benzoate-CoA ligase family protein